MLTPEERMERISDIRAQSVLRLIDAEKNGVAQEQKQIEPEIVNEKPAMARRKKQDTEEFLDTNDVIYFTFKSQKYSLDFLILICYNLDDGQL